MSEREIRVGIISDTHGLLRPQAIEALRGSEVIIHAGDVGKPNIIQELRRIAPVFAVRGNVDNQAWAMALPITECVEVGAQSFWVIHEIAQLDIEPLAAGIAAVVFGHSHKPLIETRGGILYINPGSAGPRRFALPVSVARALVSGEKIRAEIVELDV
ncbi:MAG: metallophosphoesterase family protein [Rhodomicrobiaceae bacterium]